MADPNKVKNLPASRASVEEFQKALDRVSIKDPDHLKRWIASRRPFLVFVGEDLSEALKPFWPECEQELQRIINQYMSHRLGVPTGDVKRQKDPITGKMIDVPLYKDDTLTLTELDRLVRWAVAQIMDHDPNWKLTNPAL